MNPALATTTPPDPESEGFHELWWSSVEAGWAPSGKLKVPLHEIWEWSDHQWKRPGMATALSPEQAHGEGWRYVRAVEMLNNPRLEESPCPETDCREELEIMLHMAKRIIDLQTRLLGGWAEPLAGATQRLADDWIRRYAELDRQLEAG